MALLYRAPGRSTFKGAPGFRDFSDPLYNGLIAAYLFNEGGGQTVFDSAYFQAASLVSTYNWTTYYQGAAINFNGGNVTGPTGALDPYTWAFWANFSTTAPRHQAIIAKSDGGQAFGTLAPGKGWVIEIDGPADSNNGIQLDVANAAGNARLTYGQQPALNSWHFYVLFWDKTGKMAAPNAGIYVDGQPVTLSGTTTALGTYASDASEPLFVGQYNGNSNPCSNAQVGSVMMWNRILTAREVQDLYVATYPQARRNSTYIPASAPVVPSQDFIFYDSFDYKAKARPLQQFQRNNFPDISFIQPTVPFPSQGYLFYDSFDYRARSIRPAQQFQRDFVANITFEPTFTPAPSLDFIFRDYFDYRAAPLRAANFRPNYIADASYIAAINFPVVYPSQYQFDDAYDYRAKADRIRQASFDRNLELNIFQATQPITEIAWLYRDPTDYTLAGRRAANFQRNYIADASFLFEAAVVPSFDYKFYDAFDYAKSKRQSLLFPRDYIADASFFAAITLPVLETEYLFQDSTDYVGRARYMMQKAFERNWIADANPSASIAAAFISVDSWLPIITPISIPTRQTQSAVFMGLPNDIRDGTTLPSWDLLQLGDSSLDSVLRREAFRQWFQQVQPYKPELTFLSVFFTATWAPWNATLTKGATRNFNAVWAPWNAALSLVTSSAPTVAGYILNVCQELRTLMAIKFNTATICEDPRTVTVPINTQPVCKTFIKDPQATTDYSIDWTAPLQAAGDTIATTAWTTDPGIAVAKSTYVGYVTTAFISGGTEGSSYSVTNTITTVGGRTLAQNFIIRVMLR